MEKMIAALEADRDSPGIRIRWAPWVVIGGIALAIRCQKLTFRSYWLDEILDVYTLRHSWRAMWKALQEGVYNAPLDYAIRKLVENLGPSDGLRRLVGVAWGTATVLLFGVLIARRSERRIGLTASAFLAFAPYHVRYSQEVRPYALALFLVCLDLLLLDRYLERPSRGRLLALAVTSLAGAYSSYLAALMILVAAGALVAEDALSRTGNRRRSVRQLLRNVPLLLACLIVGYLPWWKVLAKAFQSPGLSEPPAQHWARAWRVASYFGFGSGDWQPLGLAGALFLILVLSGAALATTRFRLFFLVTWAFGGLALVEILERSHSVYDSVFHYLPAAMALTGLAAASIGWLSTNRRILQFLLIMMVIALEGRGVTNYFAHGRPDWRPLASFLRNTPSAEPILVGSQYTQLCVGYYVNGPSWLCCPDPSARPLAVISEELDASGWHGSSSVWLVLSGGAGTDILRRWSDGFPTYRFPDAEGEGGAIVRHLTAP